MSKDVRISAPVATFGGRAPAPLEPPSVEELYQLTHQALKDERRKCSELSDMCRQTSSLCLALTKLLVDSGHPAVTDETVTIPRWLHEQMLGASITVGQTLAGEPTVKIVERGRERIHAVQ